MQNTPGHYKLGLAHLYDGPVADAEAAEMADRLCDFMGLLLEIQAEKNEAG